VWKRKGCSGRKLADGFAAEGGKIVCLELLKKGEEAWREGS
jgi:hypothetical protein